jgi:hypothetical protein
MSSLLGKYVTTYDGHSGVVIKHFKPTGREMTVHIKQDDGRIWYCPDKDIISEKSVVTVEAPFCLEPLPEDFKKALIENFDKIYNDDTEEDEDI